MTHYQIADEITLVHSGSDYFDRLEALLDAACESIHLHVYIFAEDDTGRRIADALRRAAARGVTVYVLADAFGSRQLMSETFVRSLQESELHFRFFEHAISFWKWRFGRTLHHKIVVADARHALIGGINIADKYRGASEEAPWLDFAVYVRGDVCQYLFHLCRSIYRNQYFKKSDQPRETRLLRPGDRHGLIRFRQNDWLRRKIEVYRSYRQVLTQTRSSLVLTASYFLPGVVFRAALARVAQRGASVKILLTGPTDVPLSQLAEQYLAHWLLRHGIRVFRWEHSVMHGKTFLSDGRWASVGSYNLNNLSRYRSLELNADILDPAFTAHFERYLDDLLSRQCTEINLENTPPFSGPLGYLKTWLAYHFSYYLMRVSFAGER